MCESVKERERETYQVVQVGPGVIDTLEGLHDDSAGFICLVLDEGTALFLHPLQVPLLLLQQLLHLLKGRQHTITGVRTPPSSHYQQKTAWLKNMTGD